MSADSNQRSEDQFLCSICLDVFTDPVSTSCGHNFCRTCIIENWYVNDWHQCPVCKEVLSLKPELKVNTLLAELADEFRRSAGDGSQEQQAAQPQEVPPDVNTGAPEKSWAVWLMGACVFVVFACMIHHSTVNKEKQGQLLKTVAEISQLIQESQLKMAEFELSVERSKRDADKVIAEADQAFTALKESSKKAHAELIDSIKKRQKASEMEAEGSIKELQQLIRGLKKRRAEVEISAARLEQMLAEEMKKEVPKLARAELQRVQVYAVEVTLDPDTAHPYLILSDDGKQVHHCGVRKNLPNNPERFSLFACVLGKQSFTSGRFYFEVQVKGKTNWDLGVAKESINRKGPELLTPKNGYWTIWLRDDMYEALEDYAVDLYFQSPLEKVGVFVDYEGGLVSFYDVDSASLIYSFTRCSFTERIYPYFSPVTNENGRNAAPLIITSVKH